jgi:hypothetical protein
MIRSDVFWNGTHSQHNMAFIRAAVANKALVQTAPALSNFGIIARHNRFGGGIGAFLPHRARKRRHNAGVSALWAGENTVCP